MSVQHKIPKTVNIAGPATLIAYWTLLFSWYANMLGGCRDDLIAADMLLGASSIESRDLI